MKTNMAQASLDVYHQHVKGRIDVDQKKKIAMTMIFGQDYTRAELGKLCGMTQTSAGRAVNEMLAEDEPLIEDTQRRRKCSVTGYSAGTVMLSLADGA